MASLTEGNESSHLRRNRQHNDGEITSLGSLLGLRVELSNGIVVQTKHKNNNQTYIHKGFKGIETGCFGGPPWEQNLNSSQQEWCVGIQVELILD